MTPKGACRTNWRCGKNGDTGRHTDRSSFNEKDEALAERTSQLIEKQEEIDNYIAETKTYDVVLRVKPEKASQIKSRVINGQKCLVIPMDEDEHATINGVNTTV